MGSANGIQGSTDFYEYDPAIDSWIKKAPFIGHSRQACIGFTLSEYGYIGGGEENYRDVFTDFYKYDPKLDFWTLDTTKILTDSATTAWCSSFVLNNIAYYGLGAKFHNNGLRFSKSFFRFEFPFETPINTSKNQINTNPIK